MLYLLYSAMTTAGFLAMAGLSPAFRFLGGTLATELPQRLGTYPVPLFPEQDDRPVLWIHAASVGEVQAARGLIAELYQDRPGYRMVLTTMTSQGRRVARQQLPHDIPCLLAPLDAPQGVRRALGQLAPDLYLCLETELWPVMLSELQRQGIGTLLLNGRLSERSYLRYRRLGRQFSRLLAGFERLAVINTQDRDRFAALGVEQDRLAVCGNLKYDLTTTDLTSLRCGRRRQLQADDDELVFICGSTRSGEEALLLEVYADLAARHPVLWVVAPRHLERVDRVQALLEDADLQVTRFSSLPVAQRGQVILVDCLGELAELYAAGDHLFCGGSLVPKGGHNIMEAARCGRPVYFGPYMKDFRDAAELLTQSGGGFQVQDPTDLQRQIKRLMDDPATYQRAATAARQTAVAQHGATGRQARLVREAVRNRVAIQTVPHQR